MDTRKIDRLAQKQHGHVSRVQLRELGCSDHQMYRLVRDKGWSLVLPTVFRLPGAPPGRSGELHAARLWLRDRGHFFGSTAAQIIGIMNNSCSHPIEVAIHSGASTALLKVHRLSSSDRPPTRSVGGLRVPRTERTLMECAASMDADAVGRLLDEALRRGLTTVKGITNFLDERPQHRRRGTTSLKKLLKLRDVNDETIRSVLESRMLAILRSIPDLLFIPDYEVVTPEQRYVVDFFLPEAGIAIECHSRRWHGPEASLGDLRRDRSIRAEGIELLYFSWHDTVETPTRTKSDIQRAHDRRLDQRWQLSTAQQPRP